MQGLYRLKPWFTRRLGAGVDAAVRRGTSPDVFTAAGVVSAAGAGVAIAFGWWPVALVLLVGRLAGANLDGAVARARGVSRPWGFVLNELGDRTSDLLAFAGLAVLAWRTGSGAHAPGGPDWSHGAWPRVVWVLVAALAATLPTFVSLAAAGAGAPRANGGPLGKTERCLALVVACALPGILVVVCAVVTAGSVLTAVLRARRAHRALSSRQAQGAGAVA